MQFHLLCPKLKKWIREREREGERMRWASLTHEGPFKYHTTHGMWNLRGWEACLWFMRMDGAWSSKAKMTGPLNCTAHMVGRVETWMTLRQRTESSVPTFTLQNEGKLHDLWLLSVMMVTQMGANQRFNHKKKTDDQLSHIPYCLFYFLLCKNTMAYANPSNLRKSSLEGAGDSILWISSLPLSAVFIS